MTDFQTIVDGLQLGEMEKRYLLERWLDQVHWLARKAGQTQHRYYGLRLTTMIGAVLTPALASGTALGGDLARTSQVAVWCVGVIVAVSAAIEQLFHYGERWHNYRLTVEQLKSLGWQFFELGPAYSARGKTHAAAFPFFLADVEQVLQSDVNTYLTKITAEPQGGKGAAAPG
jgi:hypothetical protein